MKSASQTRGGLAGWMKISVAPPRGSHARVPPDAALRMPARLERPRARRPHRHDAPAALLAGPHLLRRLLGQLVALAVHAVLLEALRGDRAERASADVQRHRGPVDAALCEGPQEFVGEVKARGGRRDGAGCAGVDRLVALAILLVRSALDVGRERHRADLLQELLRSGCRAPDVLEGDAPAARRVVTLERDELHGAPVDPEALTGAELLGRPHESAPRPRAPAAARGSRKSASTTPPVSRRAWTRAGRTRVSFSTRRSPGRSHRPRSPTTPCSAPRASPPGPATSRRAASRGSTARCAISSPGRSKSKSAVCKGPRCVSKCVNRGRARSAPREPALGSSD